MREIYNRGLLELTLVLGEMAGLSGAAMEKATEALLNADLDGAEEVISSYDHIAELSQYAEERAFALLALQAPVAGDLRAVVSGIQIVADVERMGALALHVAKIARRRHPNRAVPVDVECYFADMGHIAVALGAAVEEILRTHDPLRAARLNDEDEAMDDIHRHLFTLLMDQHWVHGVEAAVDVTLLSRFYERFADHAVAVGRRVVFLSTGRMPQEWDDSDLAD
jgi:phosphate transport system protein